MAIPISGPLPVHVGHPPAPPMDSLMFFGFVTAVLSLLFYVHQKEFRTAILGVAACLAAMTVYTFIQGAWPAGLMLGGATAATFNRWLKARKFFRHGVSCRRWTSEARVDRLFGANSESAN